MLVEGSVVRAKSRPGLQLREHTARPPRLRSDQGLTDSDWLLLEPAGVVGGGPSPGGRGDGPQVVGGGGRPRLEGVRSLLRRVRSVRQTVGGLPSEHGEGGD